MTQGRGKKINPAKNDGSARDFAAGKKLGRKKQRWTGTGWEKYVEGLSERTVLSGAQSAHHKPDNRAQTPE
jgi:hypothetical protein